MNTTPGNLRNDSRFFALIRGEIPQTRCTHQAPAETGMSEMTPSGMW